MIERAVCVEDDARIEVEEFDHREFYSVRGENEIRETNCVQ